MKPSFYHLAFELCSEVQSENGTASIEQRLPDDFYPTLSFRPFSDTIRSTSERSSSDQRRKRAGFDPLRRGSPQRRCFAPSDSRHSRASHGRLSFSSPTAITIGHSDMPDTHREADTQDWRFGKISVDSIDMEEDAKRAQSKQPQNLTSLAQAVYNMGGSPLKGKYVPSCSKTSDLGWGVVHLYRDIEPSDGIPSSSADRPLGDIKRTSGELCSIQDCTTLCILAVPTYMTPPDLLGWLGESTREEVSHFRLVRTGRTNKYMVLLKFRDAAAAASWQRLWDCKPFNSTEPENCHVVFVKSLQFQSHHGRQSPSSFPSMDNDPFIPSDNTQGTACTPTALTNKPAPPPTPSLVELPTCPVCLERMDETTGLATIFCQHVFHCACLQKWRGSGCPVCRYTQHDNAQASKGKSDPQKQTECRTCGTTANPWICLICGHVGCGRYEEAHARAHFEDTSHSFAMDISTQHIWDYTGDEYVHRLIQNKADGQLVELPSAVSGRPSGGVEDEYPKDKMENMSLEYASMLTSQLDNQRLYFEEQVDRAADKASKAVLDAEAAYLSSKEALATLAAVQASHEDLRIQVIPSLEREKERAERKAEKFESTARRFQTEWREKDVINESLMDRIRHLDTQVKDLTLKNSDLEEQNRDLSFFISSSEKLRDQGEEVQEGTVTVGPGKKKKGRGKK